MSSDQGAEPTKEFGKETVAIALGRLFETVFSASVIGPALQQVGLTIGDHVKSYRIKNLMSLNQKLDEVFEERGIDRDALQKVSLSVGFPLLEKLHIRMTTIYSTSGQTCWRRRWRDLERIVVASVWTQRMWRYFTSFRV